MVKRIMEKLGWAFLTAIFSLLIGYFLLSRTERGNEMLYKEQSIDNKFEKKADKDYVDGQDEALEKSFNTYKSSHADETEKQHAAVLREFDDIKRNQAVDRELIIEAIKEK